MKSSTESSNTLIKKIQGLIWMLGLHAFSLIIFLVLIDLIVGGFIFYKYVFLPMRQEATVSGVTVKFDSLIYNRALKDLHDRVQDGQ